jgi:ribosomal-protein-alanine N-acetyltransferase
VSVQIRTSRFVLRELTVDDVNEQYLEWLRDPDALRFITTAAVTQELDDLRRYVRDRIGREDVLFLGIFDAETGVHVGNIKYEPIDAVAGYAIMGVLIGDRSYRGRGVTTEVLNESVEWLRANRGIREIALGVGTDNPGAIRAYEKAGFVIRSTPHIDPTPGTVTMVREL